MNLRTLLATAAVGLVISAGAFAADNAMAPAAAGTPAPASSYNSMPSQTAATAPASSATAPASAMAMSGQTQSNQTVLQLADSNSQFSTLAKAIRAAGLEQTLSAQGPMTVFAPTNAAFAKLGPAKLNELMNPANKQELAQILTYHVVPQNVTAQTQTASAAEPASLTTDEGQKLNVTRQGSMLQVQNARSVGAPMNASNGSIIAIDSVLMPEAQAKMGMAPAPQNAMQGSNSMNSNSNPSTAPAGAMAPGAPATR